MNPLRFQEDRQRLVDENWARYEARLERERVEGIDWGASWARPEFVPPAPLPEPSTYPFIVNITDYKEGGRTAHTYHVTALDQNHAENIALGKHRSAPHGEVYWIQGAQRAASGSANIADQRRDDKPSTHER